VCTRSTRHVVVLCNWRVSITSCPSPHGSRTQFMRFGSISAIGSATTKDTDKQKHNPCVTQTRNTQCSNSKSNAFDHSVFSFWSCQRDFFFREMVSRLPFRSCRPTHQKTKKQRKLEHRNMHLSQHTIMAVFGLARRF